MVESGIGFERVSACSGNDEAWGSEGSRKAHRVATSADCPTR